MLSEGRCFSTDIRKLIEDERKGGYNGAAASAKVCQDIVLLAIARSMLSKNVTIKGGVVMRSKTKNTRRATQDLDIDFIRYSLSDESIDAFINKLNCIEGIKISRDSEIMESRQQDYKGKKVFIKVADSEGNILRSKLDLGVHNRLELEQEEYCFDIAYDTEGVYLLINSYEQMFAEKLRSLLKFGPLSTRYKDIFDLYYIKDHVKADKLHAALDIYIFQDDVMKEKDGADIVKRLTKTFRDKVYLSELEKSDKRWVDDDVSTVIEGLLKFVKQIQ